jgi:eukaryotic-like serine/threonine-protein kinase
MESSHRRGSGRWRQPSLLINMLLGTLLLSACTTSTAGTATTGGALRWRFQTDGGRIDGLPTVVNGLVYALEARTGAVRWRFLSVGQGSAPPAVVNGVIYRGSHDGAVSAQDASTGAVRWQFTGALSNNEFPDAPAVEHGVVYVVSGYKQAFGSTHGLIFALDATTGAMRWRFATNASVNSPSAVANGAVYVAVYVGSVYALYAKSGAQRWRFQTDGASTLVVANGAVYVSSGQFLYTLTA